MTDFVINENSQEHSLNCLLKIRSYANFLKQKLELWMFVPCNLVNGVWVVLEEPTCDCATEFDREGCYDKCYEYINAKNRVLFDGFELYDSSGGYKSIQKGELEIFWYNPTSNIGENKWRLCPDFKYSTIEDLVKYNLELTPTAQKLIGL